MTLPVGGEIDLNSNNRMGVMLHALSAAVQAKRDQVYFQAAEIAAVPDMCAANAKTWFLLGNLSD
jgi:hypothetical protein